MSPEIDRLAERLGGQGLRPVARIRVTENRTVLVSLSRQRVLSVHRAYLAAPDEILRAIVTFVSPGTRRDVRRRMQQLIVDWYTATGPLGHPATGPLKRRPERPRPGDDETLARLGLLFSEYNQRHFDGTLPAIPIHLSSRMKSRLGQLTLDDAGQPSDISISRRHLKAHGWDEVAHTLLHEMVHLWQCASGHAVDHGSKFRAKAREVGVEASARRWVRKRPAARTTHYAPLTLFG
jgi:hypothetical protein